ncbi:MAG TPA: chromosome segregation protein SMC [Leptolyngbyaceae cyanobacterium M33_DOE_097]|uniref:Chromosome partition protein Smc n=1 Tax=Oscillatoriales cyanobacterium SpSt-418 TaxID=2282169 RepID=A0A7C3PGK5_9CYAN|nr:chromosome segregation protein SMC [Leptolyngbyaceae cyanobacterium M33_DOE_097]
MYIKRLELTNFKSFGGTTQIPLLPGFTVISGPNGSGKSNLIDALLFCLGLAGSKGMRAERLPDLVNHTQTSRSRATVEASVTVTFDLTDEPELLEAEIERQVTEMVHGETLEALNEAASTNGQSTNGHHVENGSNGTPVREWSVTRKLRVTQQGTYTSNYYINGEPCTLTELHEELNRLRIYPEGYNVVLQGDVTRIISMNSRERREIIDELAGVATFDRKINQAKEKLDAVKEQEDRYRIVERELIEQRDRLAQDRVKAEKYQKLRAEVQTKEQWEIVIRYRQSEQAVTRLEQQIAHDEKAIAELTEQLAAISTVIQQASAELEQLNQRVKALGEEELLTLQSTLATREAELRQLQRQEQEMQTQRQQAEAAIVRAQQEIQSHRETLTSLTQTHATEAQTLTTLIANRDAARQTLEQTREAANASAANAEAWVQEQTQLHRQIETLVDQLEPQRAEQAQLQERTRQLERQLEEQTQTLQTQATQLAEKQTQATEVGERRDRLQTQVQELATRVSLVEQELKLQQETQTRLLHEQRDKQRRLDKLEAQTQAIQEAQGTYATQLILQSDLPGVCGLVAQLGRVDPRYQLALETAAGARLGNLVVEDDSAAAAGIELLKQKRAGRATFLPLNKIQRARSLNVGALRQLSGCVDYAFNLIEFDDRYRDVFAYVFGNTVVFENLHDARRHMGDFRIVTLDGELLETSGAMTGGSTSSRQTIHFGTMDASESAEVLELRDRLKEIEQVLVRCENAIFRATELTRERGQELIETRQNHREAELQTQQLETEIRNLSASLEQGRSHLTHNQQELATAQTRLQALVVAIPEQETQLQELRHQLATLEASHTHSEWQQIQTTLRSQEAELNQHELALRTAEQHLKDLENQRQREQEKLEQSQTQLQAARKQQTAQLQQFADLNAQQNGLNEQIALTKAALTQLEQRLGQEKQDRDRAERQLREHQTQQQQLEWQQQKRRETMQERQQELATQREQLLAQEHELPDPLPELPDPEQIPDLAALQHEIRLLQKRIQAMEPVNMLALEEYDRTQARLEELSQKLTTLEQERTDLLLRIENFTTLRQRAFKEAFDAVNENFQATFATLSDGDGRLQLDDPDDPFNGGLNLIAHPKGKPVQRLASMSGGEKSLTALSFIFSLQRYRPSPFYAFDEVDMFLDGANVERLARMIKQQAQQAQFIVVSLRRPMIESAQRTIGVTQARGAYTQVLGINLQSPSSSS